MHPKDLKRRLVSEGFQVFRTLGTRVVLADRVRENLIMDSGVAAESTTPHSVRVVIRARAGDYPGESEEQLFQRVRDLAETQLDEGYREVECAVVPLDQADAVGQQADAWYEVTFERSGLSLEVLLVTLRTALTFRKTA